MTKVLGLKTQTNVILFAANVVGAIVYVWRASLGWVNPIEKENGIHSLTAEPFIWAFAILPVCALFFCVNLYWGVAIVWRRQWRSGRIWLLAALVWVVAAIIDFAHH